LDDCLGVLGGTALPGSACTDTSGYNGIWSDACECVLNVGIGEQATSPGLILFPNPASTLLRITTANRKPVHVQVFDMVGALVLEADKVNELNIGDLAPGSYSLVATDEHGADPRHARFVKR
jgi:hypothetical protein